MRSSDPTGARVVRGRLRHRLQLPNPPDPRDFNAQAAGAGLTALALYLFAPIPIQVAVAAKLGLSPGQTAGWIFAGWLPAGLGSMWLSLRHRQPIPIVMSVPAVIYLGTLGGELSYHELMGANVAAGVLILGLALLGAGERIAAFVPLPIVLGMFAGTLLDWVLGIAEATFTDAAVAGSAIAGYAAVRRLDRRWLPPVPVAAATGAGPLRSSGGSTSTWSGGSRRIPISGRRASRRRPRSPLVYPWRCSPSASATCRASASSAVKATPCRHGGSLWQPAGARS
jgi:hypothetical protein